MQAVLSMMRENEAKEPQVEVSRGTYLLDTAQLDPHYDDKFFQEVDMPDVVYIVKGGELVPVKDPAGPVKDK